MCAGSADSLAGSLTCAQGKQIGKLEGLRGEGRWVLTKYWKYLLFYCWTNEMHSSRQNVLDTHKILLNSKSSNIIYGREFVCECVCVCQKV